MAKKWKQRTLHMSEEEIAMVRVIVEYCGMVYIIYTIYKYNYRVYLV